MRVGSTFGDAIAGRRTLPREDRTVLGTVATLVLVIAGISAVFPWIVGWFVAIVSGWFGIVLGFRALHHARRARKEDADTNEDSE